jgi:hypothetical protein
LGGVSEGFVQGRKFDAERYMFVAHIAEKPASCAGQRDICCMDKAERVGENVYR